MGMFDSVYAPCPTCGEPIEFQSKEHECMLNKFTLENAPAVVLFDILNEPEYCQHCGNWCCLFDPNYPPETPGPPKPSPKMKRVRQPQKPIIHETQKQYRWWDEPFSIEDMEDA